MEGEPGPAGMVGPGGVDEQHVDGRLGGQQGPQAGRQQDPLPSREIAGPVGGPGSSLDDEAPDLGFVPGCGGTDEGPIPGSSGARMAAGEGDEGAAGQQRRRSRAPR
jgi:hypothetical protein